jgi:hypothetical protein
VPSTEICKKCSAHSECDDFTQFHRPAGHVFTQFLHLQVEFFASSRCDDFWPRRAPRFRRPAGVRICRALRSMSQPKIHHKDSGSCSLIPDH